MPTNYGPQYTSSYQKVYDDLRARYKVSVAALMGPELALDLTYFQPDGIHPNARAQPLLLDNVWPQLSPLLVSLSAASACRASAASSPGTFFAPSRTSRLEPSKSSPTGS